MGEEQRPAPLPWEKPRDYLQESIDRVRAEIEALFVPTRKFHARLKETPDDQA